MLIVDSQVHLWQDAKMAPPHRQVSSFTVDDLLAEMAAAGVDGVVITPPNLGEPVNAQAVEAARAYPDRFCILGNFDLKSPERESIVARWKERPGMLGLRFTLSSPEQKAWWTDGTLDWFWPACEKAGLVVGLLATGANIGVLGRIAERHPGLRLHIDHMGCGGGAGAGKDAAAFVDIREMEKVARHPNVGVKLSAAPSLSSAPWPHANIHPYIRQVFEAFGPDRCFWGTDLTRMPCTYRECVTMFTEHMPWLKGRDLERVMGGAIVDWLGWKRPVGPNA
jgi:predicted TIM-barrel fold metal-dependent hydrolase